MLTHITCDEPWTHICKCVHKGYCSDNTSLIMPSYEASIYVYIMHSTGGNIEGLFYAQIILRYAPHTIPMSCLLRSPYIPHSYSNLLVIIYTTTQSLASLSMNKHVISEWEQANTVTQLTFLFLYGHIAHTMLHASIVPH